MKVSFVIPTFNEHGNITRLINNISLNDLSFLKKVKFILIKSKDIIIKPLIPGFIIIAFCFRALMIFRV